MPKPLCFMIMPYGRKPTGAETGRGPAEIDFNALWDRGYVPVIKELGYEAVRADQDTGALIVSQMLERLYFADIVLADMTIANGNVYYEVGIRHAAKKTGCVLLASDWSKALFDVAQLRTIRYPLPEGSIADPTAAAFRAAIKGAIPVLADGISPMHQSMPGYPTRVDPRTASTMKGELTELAAFQTKVRTVRAAPRGERMQRAGELIASDGSPPAKYPDALALMWLLRDAVQTIDDWKTVLDFLRKLPTAFAEQPDTREHLAFATAQCGDPIQAIAQLNTLIDTGGPTPERYGQLGGRYKRLIESPTASAGERLGYLAKAIDCYEKGMDLDLNDFYCSSNLPRLYRQRMRKGDEQRAESVLHVVIAACERAKRRDIADDWLRPTLLGAAFDAGDVDKAEELIDDILAEGPARWKLDAILTGLKLSAEQSNDRARGARLLAVVDRLASL